MPGASGFWSYVHADDQADGGRVVHLARDVVAQYEMQTGESIDLFLDKDALEWGEKWRSKVDISLASIAFFIPVITPRYFKSAECRRELQFFARQAKALGVQELVMPLLYLDFAALHEESPSDDLVALVKEFQWENWTDLRFCDPGSTEYRLGVSKLARRLVEANARAEQVDLASSAQSLMSADASADDTEPGLMDRIAEAEDVMPRWVETMQRISEQIAAIGDTLTQATADMEEGDKRGKGFAAKLTVTRKVSQALKHPSDEILDLGNDFTAQLHAVDSGFRAIIELASSSVEEDGGSVEEVCEFFDTVRNLSASAHEGLSALSGMIDAIAPIERMSRDLRPVLRQMRQGLILMLEGREVTDEWVKLIDESPVRCPERS
jgi:hypothetical protein